MPQRRGGSHRLTVLFPCPGHLPGVPPRLPRGPSLPQGLCVPAEWDGLLSPLWGGCIRGPGGDHPLGGWSDTANWHGSPCPPTPRPGCSWESRHFSAQVLPSTFPRCLFPAPPVTRGISPFFSHSARMRGQGELRRPPCDPVADTIDSSGPSLTLPSGGCLSAVGLPPGPGREALEKALVIQESER